MTLVKFNPEKRNGSLLPGFSDVFDSIFNDTFLNDRMVTRVPAVNISETENNYHVELAAPIGNNGGVNVQLTGQLESGGSARWRR